MTEATGRPSRRSPLQHSGYLRYELERPLPWNQDLRNDVAKKIPVVKMTPWKCGDGMRLTQSGLIQVKPDACLLPTFVILETPMRLEAVPEHEFSEKKKKAMNKVFFKGFPRQVTKEEVTVLFEEFGAVEYVYFMCGPKRGRHASKIGYVIFSHRSGVDSLLSLKEPLVFQDCEISFEEYKTNIGRVRTRMVKESKMSSAETQQIEMSQNIEALLLADDGSKPLQNSISTTANSPQLLRDRLVIRGVGSTAARKEECSNERRPWLILHWDISRNHANRENIRFNLDSSRR